MKTFLAALLLFLPFLGEAQSWKVFSMNDANPESGFQGTKECCTTSFQAETNITRFGKTSLRVSLAKSDPSPTDGSGSHRAEKYFNYGASKSAQNANLTWFAFSSYQPRATVSPDPAEEIRFQLHSNIGSPPVSLQMVNGNWRITRRNSTLTSPSYTNGGHTDIAPVNYDQWEDWVIHFVESQGTSGIIEVWRNDVLLYSYRGVTNYTNSNAIYPYPNIGIYKYAWSGWNPASTSTQRTFYIDSVFYGNSSATYANMDVTPNGVTPPATNQAPTANAGADLFITSPKSSVTLNGANSSDVDGTISSYKWTLVSGLSTANISNSSASSTTASNLAEGVYVFRLTITDNDGATDTDDITVTVGSSTAVSNIAPTANAGTAKTITLPTNSTSLTGSGTDKDGTISSYKWTQVSGPNTATFSSTTVANTTISKLVQGAYSFKLTVTDNKGATGSSTISVSVNAATTTNVAPTANAGANKSITLPTNSTGLSGSGTDPDGSISSYNWAQVSGPNTAIFSNNTTASTTVSSLIAGTYSFRLTVTDNKGATGSSTVSVTVANTTAQNKLPVVNAGTNQTITLPVSSLSLNATASDADGTIKTYKWSMVSGPSLPTFSSTIAEDITIWKLIAGNYSFRLTVTDNSGGTASATVTVTVKPAVAVALNKAPIAKTIGKLTLVGTSVTLNGEDSYDPDGTIAGYSWIQISGPIDASLTQDNKAIAKASKLAPGTYVFQLTVTDNVGEIGITTLTLEVSATPGESKPVARAGNDQTIFLPTTSADLDGSNSSDPNGTISSYIWTRISGPVQPVIATESRAKTLISEMSAEGEYVFSLTVTDNDGESDIDTILVTVKASGLNQAPVAMAATNLDISLPVDSVLLDGSSSYDKDGKITLHQWKMINGSSKAKIHNANSAKTIVSDLQPGIYVFQLTIKDDKGALGNKQVTVTVRNANGVPEASAMKIYPNPVSTIMTLRLDNAPTGKGVLKIYNMSGIAVYTEEIQNSSTTISKTINLSNLTPTTYILSLQFEDSPAMIRKFIKI